MARRPTNLGRRVLNVPSPETGEERAMGSRSRGAGASLARMKPEWSEVLEAALALPAEAREQLVEELGGVMLDADEEAMVMVGLAEADRGEVRDAEEVFRELHARVNAAARR